MPKRPLGIWIFTELLFWEQVATIYDTYGLPKDLIMLRLRQEGVEFSDDDFNTLIDYMVARRNGRGEKVDVTELLIPLPDNFNSTVESLL